MSQRPSAACAKQLSAQSVIRRSEMLLETSELDHADLRGISIEPEGPVLRVEYGVADQGGTCLRYLFHLPAKSSETPTLDCRYLHDPPPRPTEQPASVPWSDLPSRLKLDVSAWLSGQQLQAEHANRSQLASALNQIRSALGEPAA